jgi:NAD(P)-dependent dehydrogenase (short-subunit alcohol dehydrogenase family)
MSTHNILITGAGRGLGIALARQGHSILVTDLNPDSARETAPMARNVTGQTITIDGGWTAQ